MIETGSSEIDTSELIGRVGEETARGSIEADGSPIISPATQTSHDTAAEDFPAQDPHILSPANEPPSTHLPILSPPLPPPANIPPLNLQPRFHPNTDDRYHVNDLLQYHDRHFVENAYLAILKRPPEARELATYLEALRNNRIGKIELIERLLLSPEGREAKVEVSGRPSSFAKRLTQLPVLGYLLRLVKGLLRLPVMMQHQQQFELYALAQQQLIADYINGAIEQITEQRRESDKVIAELSETCGMLAEALAETSTSNQVLAELPTEVASLRRQIKELSEAQQSVAEVNQELLIHEQSVIVETQKAALGQLQSRLDELRQKQQQLSADLKSQEQLTLLLLDKVRNRAAEAVGQ
ncbi:MAG: DUF4214 domain-containing protein [Pyrinomonadaceae bacterium]|nr:DUF4214 domain-containing protein [Pyrinomonadaceae bacterium]